MHNCLNCGHEGENAFKFCPSCGTEAKAGSGSDSLLGKVLNGKYRILEEVGSGSMGRVYKAEHVSLKKPIAIKVLHEDLTVNEETVRRFQGEGIAAGKFNHPSAIQIFDFDKDDAGNWFLAMEFVEGRSLKDYLNEKGALSADGAVSLVIQVLDALSEAHRHDVIHRDLKPDNIMVVGTGSGELLVKVLDFGLSKLVDTQAGSTMMTQTGRILGTPRYMAPEQWQGSDVDHRIDIYAAGLVLYELVTGESPNSGSTIQDAMVQSSSDPVPSLLLPKFDLKVPEGLEDIVQCALAKDREDRYASAQEMIKELDRVDFDKTVKGGGSARRGAAGARRHGSMERNRAKSKQSPALMWGGIAVVVVVAAFLAFQFLGGDGETYVRLSGKPQAERTAEENKYVEELLAARASFLDGKLAEALQAIVRAQRLPCSDSESFLVRALIYRGQRDDKGALSDLQKAIELDPGYAEAVAEIGWVHFDRGDTTEAEARFEQAAGLDVRLGSAIVGQASIALEKGAADMAKERLSDIDGATSSAAVRVRLGAVFLGLDELDAAAAAFSQAKSENPFDWRAHAGLGETLLRNSAPEEALPALKKAIEYNPDADSARTLLATLYVSGEQWPEAIQAIDEALSRNSDNGRMQILKGIALHATGDPKGAVTALEAGTSRSPRDHRAWTLLGVLHQQAGRYDEAIRCYESAQAIDTGRAQAFLNHGLCLIAQKKYQDAQPLLQRATEVDQANAFAFLSLGVVYMDYLGDRAQALVAFQRYLALGGEDKRVAGWVQTLSGR
jgi:tetratricopeptide (TPR) repeat protein